MFTSINPATGDVVSTFEQTTTAELRKAIGASQKAFATWRRASYEERARPALRAATLLRERADQLALLMCREMGKPLAAGRSEIAKCAWVFEHYAEHARSILADVNVTTDAPTSVVVYRPLGVVLAVMPWNFPFWQVLRFAAPTLMAGNGAVLKHAANVSGCALAIEALLRDAGYPTDLFRVVLIDHAQLRLAIRNPAIRAVTLTGSVAAGRAIARLAGERLKKTVLELGGSDAYVILEDADLDHAAATCAASRLINGGQSCIAAKRFVVVDAVRDEFVKRFVQRMSEAVMGDPLDAATTLGPMARHDLRDELHRQVRESIEKGARCILGGEVPGLPGAFYPPTVLTDVKRGMPAYDDELFGPVAAIIPARNERAAIRIANDTVFGLGAAVFTRDVARGERIARDELSAGSCFVNALVKSDPRLPFGGVGDSGYGRELGDAGIHEFVNIKTVVREAVPG